jgi:RNA polymerase sigma-32 factor
MVGSDTRDNRSLIPEILVDETEERLGDLRSDEREAIDISDDEILIDAQKAIVRRGSRLLADQSGEWLESEQAAEHSKEVADLYRSFVAEATRYERLSEEEERALALRIQKNGDTQAIKKLVVHNLRLAIKVAHQYRRVWANLMDLVQEAATGLTIAAQKWDPDQGTRYGTYAVYWVRAQLTRFLMTNGRLIHTGNTRAGRKLYFQLPKIRRQLEAEGREVNAQTIAEEIGESPEEVQQILYRLEGREASLSKMIGENGATMMDVMESSDNTPEEMTSHQEMQRLIQSLTKSYGTLLEDERERAIWYEHLIADEPTSLVDLGKRYGVSKQRIGQISVKVKRGFRRHIIDQLGPDTKLSWLFGE